MYSDTESTVKRLLNSFYFDRAVVAPEAQLDPETMEVEVKASGHVDNYIILLRRMPIAECDPFYSDNKESSGKVEITFDDDTQMALMNAVNYKPDRSIGEVNSRRSALTGDSQIADLRSKLTTIRDIIWSSSGQRDQSKNGTCPHKEHCTRRESEGGGVNV
eukprot:scaffold39600_cov46-Cyclotella_meneghiniana.AAC.2